MSMPTSSQTGPVHARRYPRDPRRPGDPGRSRLSAMNSHRPGVTTFVHVGLVVEDLDETVRFLALLGFDCGEPGVFSGDWIDRIIGLEDGGGGGVGGGVVGSGGGGGGGGGGPPPPGGGSLWGGAPPPPPPPPPPGGPP